MWPIPKTCLWDGLENSGKADEVHYIREQVSAVTSTAATPAPPGAKICIERHSLGPPFVAVNLRKEEAKSTAAHFWASRRRDEPAVQRLCRGWVRFTLLRAVL